MVSTYEYFNDDTNSVISDKDDCYYIIEHIKKCPECQKKLLKTEKIYSNNLIEHFSDYIKKQRKEPEKFFKTILIILLAYLIYDYNKN